MSSRPRYDLSGRWYRGNCHAHTSISDGRQTPQRASELYAAQGYDFLCITDHDIPSDVASMDVDWALTPVDGVEIGGADPSGIPYHAVCLGKFTDLPVETGFVGMLEHCRAQGGLLIDAHPHLMYHSPEDVFRHGFHGIEVYNQFGESRARPYGLYHWDHMLQRNFDALAFAVDDTHAWHYVGEDDDLRVVPGGWIVVNAPACTAEDLMAAIWKGNFYASTGPSFESFEIDGDRVRIETSPIRRAWLSGAYWSGTHKGLLEEIEFTEAEFTMPEGWLYYRLEIEDAQGRHAWTNTLFTESEE